MSLRINTNVPALTAMRQLAMTEQNLGMTTTRLSTGLRINSAADDPAGMIISEGMRSQIKGLQQAVRNSQDAVNMTKTAEGALDEVSRLLLSMRAIAVASANTAVVDNNQLQANQNQVRSIISSLDRIAEQTAWGSKKLLNGASGAVTNVTNLNYISSAYFGSEVGGETVKSGNVSLERLIPATKTTVNLTKLVDENVDMVTGSFAINGVSVTVEPGDRPSTVIAKINAVSYLTNVVATKSGNPAGINLTATKFGDKFPIQYTETANIMNGGGGTTAPLGQNAEFRATVPADTDTGFVTEIFRGGQGPGVDGLSLVSASGNTITMTPGGNYLANIPNVASITVGAVRFQIGANANQFASFALPSVYARDLGTLTVTGKSIATIDVTSEAGSTEAMKIIDEAIKQLATIRGKLGSFQQNFLESNIRSLGITEENLVASESAIRDADMAKEMTEYTKLQILKQSGISVLAQASQSPRSVLNLLQQG